MGGGEGERTRRQPPTKGTRPTVQGSPGAGAILAVGCPWVLCRFPPATDSAFIRGNRDRGSYDRFAQTPPRGGCPPPGAGKRPAGGRPFAQRDAGPQAGECRSRPPPARDGRRAQVVNATRRLDALEAEARYATERYRLYRARVGGPRPTSTGRLRALQRDADFAEKTLARARAAPTQTGTTTTKENDAIDRH